MSVKILANSTQVLRGVKMPIVAFNGTAPYTFSVSGAGGTLVGGFFTAGQNIGKDTIKVVDAAGKTAILDIFTGTPLHLLADIIQKELALAPGRVWLWDQKVIMPTDYNMFIVLSEMSVKPFGTANFFDGTTNSQIISSNFYADVQIDLYSRGPEARDRKEEVILALASNYASSQQALNAFHIARLSNAFTNLSEVETDAGTAIPYRFSIMVGIQYKVQRTGSTQYFDDFDDPSVTVDP